MQLITSSGLTGIKLGLVQTAYANGASTEYINQQLVIKPIYLRPLLVPPGIVRVILFHTYSFGSPTEPAQRSCVCLKICP